MIARDHLQLGHLAEHNRPFLLWTLPQECRTLSWALEGGGLNSSSRICWIQVSPQDLTEDICPKEFLQESLQRCGAGDALGLMTSARIDHFARVSVTIGNTTAIAVVTVGLGNALRAGDPSREPRRLGTINCACWVNQSLSFEAMLEALVITAEAKTAAVMEAGVQSFISKKAATGTGTDCHVIACPDHKTPQIYAGKHTDIGSAIGTAVMQAVEVGIKTWSFHNPNHPLISQKTGKKTLEIPLPHSAH